MPPLTEKAPHEGEALVLHEDDWRQAELIAIDYRDDIEAMLESIDGIYEKERTPMGAFRRIYVRDRIADPLSLRRLPIEALRARLHYASDYDSLEYEAFDGAVRGLPLHCEASLKCSHRSLDGAHYGRKQLTRQLIIFFLVLFTGQVIHNANGEMRRIMAAVLTIEKVNKKYPDGFHAVRDVSFSVEQGETLCLLGTSGCGKTTLLKMINRLIEPTSGFIYLRGRDTRECNVTLLRRSIGYVIQSIGLFPHMRIKDNVALVPRLCGWDEKAIAKRVRDLMVMVHLEPEKFLERYPCELSGGQQQRVGVIRALAVDPDIILMDEPFGALDPITRANIQEEFIQLKSNLGKTIIIVTHDLSEAIKLGDRIALIHQGSIEQLDTPQQLIQNPASEFVKSFFSRHQSQNLPSALRASDIAIGGTSPSGNGIEINGSVSAGEAVSLYLDRGRKVITVMDDEGVPLGIINEEAIVRVFSLTFWEDLSRG